ncbi:LPS export ABC transporter periplasmic protein LptC [Sphingomonas sp. BK580]|uniref:LPS export ABC transporter periplasmic protein LptC n=1 Tax=Sphingomonas sp. BK580 TaxID=2586972 RepID=UPI00161B7A94|nr:LPS export ABC transporter periplasmic protein LptC [Sphingomonas sp. BK580]MBB3693715.1 lipopolysaccharide export system protein LptC [Sphingomonas sp. BK580]
MSEVAIRTRSERQRWAQPGGRHDRLIAAANRLLPLSIGVLFAFLVMAPLTMGGDASFVLDKNKVEVARERLKIQRARYRGTDAKGQPFALTAGSALQKSSAEPVVNIRDLAAAIRLSDGPAEMTAPTGRYDMDSEQVDVAGPIKVRGPNNYALDTTDAVVDLKTRRLRSTAAVSGTVRQGTFSGDSMRADLEARTVTLDGNARLRIDPRK